MTAALTPALTSGTAVGEGALVTTRVAGRLLMCSQSTVKIMLADRRLDGAKVDGVWMVTLASIFDANVARLLPVCGLCDLPVYHPIVWQGPSDTGVTYRHKPGSGPVVGVPMHADCAERATAITRRTQLDTAERLAPPYP